MNCISLKRISNDAIYVKKIKYVLNCITTKAQTAF